MVKQWAEKSLPDSPFARLPHGAAKAAAAAAGVSTRYIKMAWRLKQAAPDLLRGVVAGELTLIDADRALRDRLHRAARLHGIVLEGYRAEQKHDLARLAEAAPPNCPARIQRWWRAVLAVRAIPDETPITALTLKVDPALLAAQAAIGAAVHGYDPLRRIR